MKKCLWILVCLCLLNGSSAFCSSADNDETLKEKIQNSSLFNEDKRTKVTANRQVYSIKREVTNNKLKELKAEYAKIYADENMDTQIKEQKLKELEQEILKVNFKKNELKQQYNKDKKAIKNTN